MTCLPPGKTWYLYRRLGGPVWTCAENLTPHREKIRVMKNEIQIFMEFVLK
jgi:hypothetical protein